MGQYECHVFVCTSGETCPQQGDVEKMVKALRTAVAVAGKHKEVRINKSGCLDRCDDGPCIVVYPEGVWYTYVDEHDIDEIIDSHLVKGEIVERLRI